MYRLTLILKKLFQIVKLTKNQGVRKTTLVNIFTIIIINKLIYNVYTL